MTRRSSRSWGIPAAVLLLLAFCFIGLGIWQIERRAWKHELIASIDARIHKPAIAAPGPNDWPRFIASEEQYRHVRVEGRYIPDRDTRVRAVSDLGSGYWIMSPLSTGEFTVLVNRGFVSQGAKERPVPSGRLNVTGLLRITEPKGGFLRSNDPARGRWYSRDVAAIAEARGLVLTAPYFIDAVATPEAKGYPIGGLTVVKFSDNHLVYALTWFTLAVLCAAGVWRLVTRSARYAA